MYVRRRAVATFVAMLYHLLRPPLLTVTMTTPQYVGRGRKSDDEISSERFWRGIRYALFVLAFVLIISLVL